MRRYTAPGSYTVAVDVIDSAGLNTTAQQSLTVTGSNLVGNPGFECDCTNGWQAAGGSALSLTATAHTGAFAARVTRVSSFGKALLRDSPPWNGSTTAGTTCYAGAWVEVPAGVRANLRTLERQGGTVVAKHAVSVVDGSGGWMLLTVAAPITSSGDQLRLLVYANLAVGQALLVDDVTEYCQ